MASQGHAHCTSCILIDCKTETLFTERCWVTGLYILYSVRLMLIVKLLCRITTVSSKECGHGGGGLAVYL